MSLYSAYWTEPRHFLGAAIGLSVLDIVTVAARFIARKTQRQSLKADDWLMVPAVVSANLEGKFGTQAESNSRLLLLGSVFA